MFLLGLLLVMVANLLGLPGAIVLRSGLFEPLRGGLLDRWTFIGLGFGGNFVNSKNTLRMIDFLFVFKWSTIRRRALFFSL